MPTPTFLLLFFTAGAIFGCRRSYRMLITSRRGSPSAAFLYRWLGPRLSSWKYEPQVSLAIVVHTSALAALAAAGVALAFKPASFADTILADDLTMVALIWFAECGSLALTGYLLGALLGFPLASFDKQPAVYEVGEEGIIYGISVLPWHWFSHFTTDRDSRLVSFYSAFAPDLSSFLVQPPASVPLDELVGELQKHLPQQPAQATRVGYRTRKALVPVMVLFCLPLVTLSWVATRLPRELGLFTIALCAGVLAGVGGMLISTYGFGGSYTKDMKQSSGQL